MSTGKTSLELLFEEGLNHYSLLIKYRCHNWADDKYDYDDLYSEASIVLYKLAKENSHICIKSIHFRNLLSKAIKNKFIDLRRIHLTKSRNKFFEVEYDSYYEESLLQSSPYYQQQFSTDEIVATKDIFNQLNKSLKPKEQELLSMILFPTDSILLKAHEYDLHILSTKNKRSFGSKTDIPIWILGEEIGLTYKQCLRSLGRIRQVYNKI